MLTLIVILSIVGFIVVTFVFAGISVSAFMMVGGYDDVYENAVEERYERAEREAQGQYGAAYDHFMASHPELYARGGDTFVDVDARQVHYHNGGKNYLDGGAKNG